MRKLKENLLRNIGVGKIKLIEQWMKEHAKVGRLWRLDKKDRIDVLGSLAVYADEERLPDYIQFGTVSDFFYITGPNLTSLRGCPRLVKGGVLIYDCYKLKSLEGCPRIALYFCTRELGYLPTEEEVMKLCNVKFKKNGIPDINIQR